MFRILLQTNTALLCSNTLVTFVIKLCKVQDDFDDDGQLDSGAIEYQLPVGVEVISKFAKLHGKGDEGVHTLDGTAFTLHKPTEGIRVPA